MTASVAIVGAGDAIGAAIARRFAAGGFHVHGGRRQADRLAPLADEIASSGGRFTPHTLDARDPVSLDAFLDAADADPATPLDLVVFNIGANAYVPVLLGGLFKATGNQSPMMANANIPAKMAYEMLELRRFIARHGLSRFAMNPHFPVNTLLAMRAAAAAEIDGQVAAFAEAVLAAMWEQGVDLADPAALEAALTVAGLDGPRLLARAADQDVKDRLVANTRSAVEAGAFGLLSFLVGGDLYFGKNSLRDVEEAIAEH